MVRKNMTADESETGTTSFLSLNVVKLFQDQLQMRILAAAVSARGIVGDVRHSTH